jgi:hypothetical protein
VCWDGSECAGGTIGNEANGWAAKRWRELEIGGNFRKPGEPMGGRGEGAGGAVVYAVERTSPHGNPSPDSCSDSTNGRGSCSGKFFFTAEARRRAGVVGLYRMLRFQFDLGKGCCGPPSVP